MSLHQWILTIQTADESMQLFTSIDVGPNNVYYFCCNKVNRDEAITWLDRLPILMRTSFSHDDQCLICDNNDNDPARIYRMEPAENTADAIRGFDEVLIVGMITVDNSLPDKENAVEEDHLSICWKAPPQSVYSRYSNTSSSSPTATSTVSSVTDSNAPPFTQARTDEAEAFLDKAAKQMDKWEAAAQDCAKEREATERDISQALDKITKVTKK